MTTTAPSNRKNTRLPPGYYTGRRSYFLTLCFDGRRRYGANPRLARWLIARLRKHADACRFFIHAYCIMPDHLHALAAAASDILRSSDAADRVAWYIWMNPVRQGLCRAPAEYPFLGSFTEIGAKILKSLPAPAWTPPWKGERHAKDAALKAAALH